jgi:apolipoprotein N-acyltransferase
MPMTTSLNSQVREPVPLSRILALVSGILLGVSYPPFHFAYGSLFALVPWLIASERKELSFRKWFTLTFIMFLAAGAIELYWVGGAFGSPLRHRRDFYFLGLGLLSLVSNPIPMLAALAVWRKVGMFLRRGAGLFLLPLFWTAGEKLQTMIDLFIPWTPVGNSFSTTLLPAQIASVGGVTLLSFWAVFLNVLLFLIAASFIGVEHRSPKRRRIILVITWLAFFIAPHLYGWKAYSTASTGGTTVRIALIQPNVNAYEKWHGHGDEEVARLMAMSRQACMGDTPDCIIWPESAIPLFIFAPENDSLLRALHAMTDSLGCVIVTGYDDKEYFRPGEPLSISRKLDADGRAYQIHNGAMLLRPGTGKVDTYWKIVLVPFTESIPFSRYLPLINLDALRLNLGFDDCAAGSDTTVFTMQSRNGHRVRFSTLVCYESAFPEFTSRFVGNGAEFLCVVTNDSWWGNTSGPYQHEQFAAMRAIENRCWVVQCANGGISAFVDPMGNTVASTEMFTEGILKSTVTIDEDAEPAFFTSRGDWVGRGCLFGGIVLGVLAAVTVMTEKFRRKGHVQ